MRPLSARRLLCALLLALPLAASALPASPHIEDLTWTELRDRLQAGSTTVLVPIGGTEQNGPHMVLGKHNVRVRVLAGQIAQRLGNAVVAPVLAYVPEGAITPPAAHMRFTGTISISEASFEAVLESTARSFRQHGFKHVFFLGDHGGYQKSEERVAARLNREWASTPGCRVHALADYYLASQGAYAEELRRRGYGTEEIGTHAGLADTAMALAVDPALVRQELMVRGSANPTRDGVYGDPRRATAEAGRIGVEATIAASVATIKALTRAP